MQPSVKLGSGLALTFGIQAFVEMIRGIAEMIRKLPPAVKLILVAAVAIALLHPTSREKLIQWLKKIWERLRETKPVLVSISQGAVKHLAEAAKTHLLAYFPPESAGSVRDLLARINVVGQPGERDSHTQMSMATVVHEIETLGGVAVAAHIDRPKTGFELLVNGYPNWKKDIISASGLYGLDFTMKYFGSGRRKRTVASFRRSVSSRCSQNRKNQASRQVSRRGSRFV